MVERVLGKDEVTGSIPVPGSRCVSSVELEWVVYVLRSAKDSGFYVGMTSNLERRVKEHSAGQNRSTKSRAPFEVIIWNGAVPGRRHGRERST